MNRLLVGADDKTALMRHFIQKDFPTGFTVIDHTGRLARAIADCVPAEHAQDVLFFDPSDAEHIASFNVLKAATNKHSLVEDLVAFFDLMFPVGETTLTRLHSNTVFKAILTILLDQDDASFSSVLDFISDETFREKCIEQSGNKHAERMWKRTAKLDKTMRANAFALIEAKIDNILLSPVLSRTLNGGRGFYLDKTRIFIADLSREKIGDAAAKLLGTLLISRATTPVYIPDFGFFASDYLASQFSKGGYTIALQALSDVPKNIEQTLLGFGEKYVYRSTPDDAEKLRIYVSGVINPGILVDLPPGQFLPKLSVDPPIATGSFKGIVRRSIARHAKPASPEGYGW